MRITLLGATGSVGAHVVEQAPADGHEIVALVRDPARLPARPGLTVVRGDATVPADVTAAVDGSDAGIVGIGAGPPPGGRGPGTPTAREAVNGWQLVGIGAWLAVLGSIAEGVRQRRAAVEERAPRAEAARRGAEAQRGRPARRTRTTAPPTTNKYTKKSNPGKRRPATPTYKD
ncbi:NAD(P)H-binding protein, partial [Nocardia farcinica]|uniref:NAD(P)H-binding protein n=1 Tax=Nocardia farcinica TaxID=37329 RepID=UPI0024567CB0